MVAQRANASLKKERGIGKETVRQLADGIPADATIFLPCRSVSKGHAAAEEIRTSSVSTNASRPSLVVVLHVIECDLTSFASVRNAVSEILKLHPLIDAVINNAGVMTQDLHHTLEGHES